MASPCRRADPHPKQQQHRRHRHAAEDTHGDIAPAPAGALNPPIKHRRPDRAADIIAAGRDGHRQAAIAVEPVRGLRHQRRERRRGPEADQEMNQNELPQRGRKPAADVGQRQDRGAEPDRHDDPEAIGDLAGRDTAETKAEHQEGKGQRDIAAGRAEFGLDHRKHDHHRPHADAADRADHQREREPDPCLTGVGGEKRRICR